MKLLLALTISFAATLSSAKDFDHSHTLWSELLKEAVVSKGALSQVNYKQLKKSPKRLNDYASQLSAVPSKQFQGWSKDQQKAFLINAYNAFTVKLIVDNYPVKSIKDIGGLFSSPWKKKVFSLFGKKTHLDHIEHGILRKKYKEPRVHFAVNCASVGCPALRGEAYTADQLEKQLEEQTRLFLRDKNRNRILKDEVEISKIFDWFEEDFVASKGSVGAFIAPYITDDAELQSKLKKGKIKIDHLSYDWGLNAAGK